MAFLARVCLGTKFLLAFLLGASVSLGDKVSVTTGRGLSESTTSIKSPTVIPTSPNIIFFMCDSMDGRNMDPTSYQYSLMNMPTLRGIASQGVNFIRTYTNSPQCVPGRAAFMTGRHTHEQGGYSNNMGFAVSSNGTLDSNCVSFYDEKTCTYFATKMQNNNLTLLDAMQNLGYNVYLYGKIDMGGGLITLPSQSNSTGDGWHSAPTLPIFARAANIGKGTKESPVSGAMLNTTDSHVHAEDHNMSARCVEKLNALGELQRSAQPQQPFFLQCSFNIPHPPFQTNNTWLQSVNVSSIKVPPYLPESEMHPYDRYMSQSKECYTENFTDADILNVRGTYYGMNVETDYLFKGVYDAALANGYNLSNTIFAFVSDHGEMNMEHRQDWKNSMYEGSSRIPLTFAGPGISKGKIVTNLTQIIDLLPTFIEIAAGTADKVPGFLSGQSLVRFLQEDDKINIDMESDDDDKEKEDVFKDYIMSQYHSNMGNTGSFMIRRDRWKYIQFGHYLEAFSNYSAMLFDVEEDIWELNDLAKQRNVNETIDNIMIEMEALLESEVNYEYVDCKAKQNDFKIFEEYFWNKYNETELKIQFADSFSGFDDNDWQSVVSWRNEMIKLGNGSIEVCDSLY